MMASSPLYTCMESALMILARRHPGTREARFMCNARSMASLDFPTPVVPHIATIDLRGTAMDVWIRSHIHDAFAMWINFFWMPRLHTCSAAFFLSSNVQ